MPNTLPKVYRLDLTDQELAFVTLLLQSIQAKLQFDLQAMFAVGATITTIADKHFEVLQSIGKKMDVLTDQDEYDMAIRSMVYDLCPDCGTYHKGKDD